MTGASGAGGPGGEAGRDGRAGWSGCALVVPAGGTSRRMGVDKLAEPLGASTVLGELLARVPDGVPVVVVGPVRTAARPGPEVVHVTEEPPGGGPAAAVAAGLTALDGVGADVVVLCAGDAPRSPLAVPALVGALRAAAPGTTAAVAVDASGRWQPLLSAHRRGALRERLAAGGLVGRPARWLLAPPVVEVAVHDGEADDVDTPEQLAAARRRSARG